MPTFRQIEVTTTVDVDFDVYCSCGAPMYNGTDTRSSRRHNTPRVVVYACKRCIESATYPLEERIADLEAELAEAREHFLV